MVLRLALIRGELARRKETENKKLPSGGNSRDFFRARYFLKVI